MATANLAVHHHGKSKVRVGRVWREGNVHHMVEWCVNTMVDSDMERAFTDGDNTGMTATDTQKNAVFVVAKKIEKRCSVEQFAIALAQHFVQIYPRISKAKVEVEQKAWQRFHVDDVAHDHGFQLAGEELRTTFVVYDKAGKLDVTSGVKNLSLLKTTQSGYEGFIHDLYTTLPDSRDRLIASKITCTWRYTAPQTNYDETFQTAKRALFDAFFGPPKGGVYSPSVQYTLYQMGSLVLERVPQIQSVFLNMPNLHFLPVNPPGSKYQGTNLEDDTYHATSEPHGNIEAVVTRKGFQPHSRF